MKPKTLADYLNEGYSLNDFRYCNCCEDCYHARYEPARTNCAAEDAYPAEWWCHIDGDYYGIDSLSELISCIGEENIECEDPEIEDVIRCPHYEYYDCRDDEPEYYKEDY